MLQVTYVARMRKLPVTVRGTQRVEPDLKAAPTLEGGQFQLPAYGEYRFFGDQEFVMVDEGIAVGWYGGMDALGQPFLMDIRPFFEGRWTEQHTLLQSIDDGSFGAFRQALKEAIAAPKR
jgi:hypothetical protein